MRRLFVSLGLWLVRIGRGEVRQTLVPRKAEPSPEEWLQALYSIRQTPDGLLYLRGLRTRFANMIDQIPPEGADIERMALWAARYTAGKQIWRDLVDEFEVAQETFERREKEQRDEDNRRAERRESATVPTGVN